MRLRVAQNMSGSCTELPRGQLNIFMDHRMRVWVCFDAEHG